MGVGVNVKVGVAEGAGVTVGVRVGVADGVRVTNDVIVGVGSSGADGWMPWIARRQARLLEAIIRIQRNLSPLDNWFILVLRLSSLF